MQAVWENVQDGFKNSYPLEHSGILINTPKERFIEGEELDLKGMAEKPYQVIQNSSQSGFHASYDTPSFYQSKSPSSHELHRGHTIPPKVYGRTHEAVVNSAPLSNELCEEEVSQADPAAEEVIDDHEEDNFQAQEPLQSPSEHILSQESDPYVRDNHSFREDGRMQGDVMDEVRVSRPTIKKIHSGRGDNDGECCFDGIPICLCLIISMQ